MFSGTVTFANRLSLRGMGSPGDKKLELRVEINLPREAKMLRAIHAEKAALEVLKVRRQRAETKLYGSKHLGGDRKKNVQGRKLKDS